MNGPNVYDACNVCGGDGTSCIDCQGITDGTSQSVFLKKICVFFFLLDFHFYLFLLFKKIDMMHVMCAMVMVLMTVPVTVMAM